MALEEVTWPCPQVEPLRGWKAGSGLPGVLVTAGNGGTSLSPFRGRPLYRQLGRGRRSPAPNVRHHSGAGREKGETPVSRLDCPACPSVQVKRAVVQVISAMAHHGYLEQPGGEAMLEYIVQQCALPPDTQVRALPLLGRGPVGSAG